MGDTGEVGDIGMDSRSRLLHRADEYEVAVTPSSCSLVLFLFPGDSARDKDVRELATLSMLRRRLSLSWDDSANVWLEL